MKSLILLVTESRKEQRRLRLRSSFSIANFDFRPRSYSSDDLRVVPWVNFHYLFHFIQRQQNHILHIGSYRSSVCLFAGSGSVNVVNHVTVLFTLAKL